jgi:hypothetical protein
MYDDLLLKYIKLCDDQAHLIDTLNQTIIELNEILAQHITVELEDQERS